MILLWMGLACGPAPIEPMLEGTLVPDGHELSGEFMGIKHLDLTMKAHCYSIFLRTKKPLVKPWPLT